MTAGPGDGQTSVQRAREDTGCCARSPRSPRSTSPSAAALATRSSRPAARSLPVPEDLSDDQAIFTEPAAVAIHAAWRKPAAAGDRVLILGCGTIGFLVDPDPARPAARLRDHRPGPISLAGRDGPRLRRPHTLLTSDDGYAEAARLTGGEMYTGRGSNRMLMGGFDIVFDVVGIAATLNNALRWTRPAARSSW